jgi:hypothetical protein
MSNFIKKWSGWGIYIFLNQKHEKATFHDIAVEKSNSVISHNPDTRGFSGDVERIVRSMYMVHSPRSADLNKLRVFMGNTGIIPC